ncbi:MAG: Zn-ribbon domain-containing protein [Candidatus Heimdallarchaeota archaeon]
MHKCVRCGAVYQDNDSSILRGCTNCGSIFFLYMKTPEEAKEIQAMQKELESKNISLEEELAKQIEKKKEEVKAAKKKKIRKPRFGVETVKIVEEGVYKINLEALMKKKPLIIFEKEKVYFIHLPSIFETIKEKEE